MIDFFLNLTYRLAHNQPLTFLQYLFCGVVIAYFVLIIVALWKWANCTDEEFYSNSKKKKKDDEDDD